MKDLQDILKNKVEKYTFSTFEGSAAPARENEVMDLNLEDDGLDLNIVDIEVEQQILDLEKEMAKQGEFIISPIVKEHRGFNKQEASEKEHRIKNEVERRLEVIGNKAYQKGYQEGLEQAREEVYKQTRAATEEKLSMLSQLISQALENEAEVYDQQKQTVYKLMNNLTKWIVLRELKDDGKYVERLCEKLVRELQVKSNILVKIDANHFEKMPEVLEHIQLKLGEIENVRVEIDYDIEGPGIIIESQNGIINGTLKEQFNSLDKLFLSVGLQPEENFDVGAFFRDEYTLPSEGESTESLEETSEKSSAEDEVLDRLIAEADDESDNGNDDQEE